MLLHFFHVPLCISPNAFSAGVQPLWLPHWSDPAWSIVMGRAGDLETVGLAMGGCSAAASAAAACAGMRHGAQLPWTRSHMYGHWTGLWASRSHGGRTPDRHRLDLSSLALQLAEPLTAAHRALPDPPDSPSRAPLRGRVSGVSGPGELVRTPATPRRLRPAAADHPRISRLSLSVSASPNYSKFTFSSILINNSMSD